MVRNRHSDKNFFLVILLMFTTISFAQEAQEGMKVKSQNYSSFSSRTAVITPELISKTSAIGQQHPEFGILPSQAPCADCYELVDDRTEFSRVNYVSEGNKPFAFDLNTDIISNEYLEGCFQLGQHYPNLCSSIFLMCEKGK